MHINIYTQAVTVVGIEIYETNKPGACVKVLLRDPFGAWDTVSLSKKKNSLSRVGHGLSRRKRKKNSLSRVGHGLSRKKGKKLSLSRGTRSLSKKRKKNSLSLVGHGLSLALYTCTHAHTHTHTHTHTQTHHAHTHTHTHTQLRLGVDGHARLDPSRSCPHLRSQGLVSSS